MKIKASYHQERVWFIHQLEGEDLYESGPVYHNIPLILEIDGTLDINLLEESLRTVANRHEALRTRMIIVEDELFQQVEPEIELKLQVLDLSTGSAGETHQSLLEMAAAESKRPFFPDGKLLIRAVLIKTSTVKSVLVITLHHLVSDRCSLGIIAAELVRCYQALREGEAPDLTDLPLHYADFSQWQRQLPQDFLESLLFYWKRQLTRLSPLELPISLRRADVHTFREARAYFHLPAVLSTKTREFCRQKSTGSDVLLLAAFKILLHRYCGQEDIVMGTSVDNRHQPDTENIVGPVANLLVLRSKISGTMSFISYFHDLVQTLEQVYENRDIPFERLAMGLIPQKDIGRTDFFDILFQYREKLFQIPPIKGLQIKYIETNLGWGKYDLNFLIWEEGESFRGILVYNKDYYEDAFISNLVKNYQILLESILHEPDGANQLVSQLDILNSHERHQILVQWNQTGTNYPRDKTIHQLFEEQVEKVPDSIAAVGLGETYQALTYKKLNQMSDLLARKLKKTSSKPATIVGIMAETSLEIIIGLLAILQIGGAYLPVNTQYPEKRKRYLLEDGNVHQLLTNRHQKIPPGSYKEIIYLEDPDIYNGTGEKGDKGESSHRPNDLAYIIYTSGSTGGPKGVMVEHRNVIRLVKNTNYMRFNRGDRILQTGALEFDASTFEIWGALLNGLELYLAPRNILLAPVKLKEIIRCSGITTIWMTAPLFNQMVDADIGIFEGLHHLLVGGDVLSPPHINRVRKHCPRLQVINGYGPTENTTFSTTFAINKDYSRNIPIGKPIANSTVYIVDKYHRVVPIGVQGELLAGGDGVARGYLNNPELTFERFCLLRPGALFEKTAPVRETSAKNFLLNVTDKNHLPMKSCNHASMQSCSHAAMQYHSLPPHYPITPLPHHPIYLTGDLARWLPGGNIEFFGRIDQQVKIRGFRVEPAEIESHILEHPSVRETVVIAYKDEDQPPFLCAYIKVNPGQPLPDIRGHLSGTLPEYMVPAYVVPVNTIPLTPNGKVDRKALPHPRTTQDEKNRVSPRNPVEDTLAEIWAEVLGMKKEVIGIDDDFFELGGHSLKATALIAKVHQQLDVKLPLVELFESPKLRELGDYITGLTGDKYAAIESVETKEYYLLSPAQKRMYILQQMVPESTTYNMPQVPPFDFLKGRDEERLEETLKKLVIRHESLRTSFEMIAGEPVQKIHKTVDFSVGFYEAANPAEAEAVLEDFTRPFDLSRAPLWRIGVLHVGQGEYLLMMDMHHIISDGVSFEVLVRDFAALYEEQRLVELRLQYKDFAQWLHQVEVKEAVRQQENYWSKEFREEVPLLNLPFDYHRPAVQSFEGSCLDFQISAEHTSALESLVPGEGATLFMILLAVINILFSKLSGQEDIIIGSPVAGRRHADLEKIMGMFVNTLTLRNYPKGEKTFSQFLKEVKENTLKAFENQEYPFENLVEKLDIDRDVSRNPLFDVMFALQTFFGQEMLVSDQNQYQFENRTAKFDLTVVAAKAGGEKLSVSLQYCTKLFRKETIARFITYFKKIISFILEAPGMKLGQIEIVSEEEKQKILYDFNDTDAQYPWDRTTHQLFEEQVEQTPDHVALIGQIPIPISQIPNKEVSFGHVLNACGGGHLSYRELNKKANQLARVLRDEGITVDSIVGLMVEPGVPMMIGMLGILKAGGAYLPIDPGLPAGRVEYIVNDAAIPVLLCHSTAQREIETAFKGKRINLDNQALFKGSRLNPSYRCQPKILAYVIYTSGSTGRPKGVAVEHSQLVNFLYHMYNRCDSNIDFHDRCLSLTNIMFDVSVWEFFLPLVFGAQLILLPKQKRFDVFALTEVILREGITLIYIPPALLKEVNEQLKKQRSRVRLNKMLVGVEPIRDEVLEDYMRLNPDMRIINGYGPTETTICASSYNYTSHEPEGEIIPIGVPLSNNQVVLLDAADQVIPQGIPGEICISGDGVSRGYLNNPRLTAEKYTAHPYFKEKRMYRTGDLARWLPDGNIRFLGRIDHQVKIRGYRIELGEIESWLLKHEIVREAVVLVRGEKTSDKYICAYLVLRKELSTDEIKQYLSKNLPDYMIPSYFVPIEKIPLTAKGKIDRKALPTTVFTVEGEVTAPRDEIESKLTTIWAEVLGIQRDIIGINANFFQLGGHSLKATVMLAKIHKELDVKIPLVEIFTHPTVQELAECIKRLTVEQYTAIEPVEKKEYYVLSSAQKRVYIEQQIHLENTNNNMYQTFMLEKEPYKKKLEETYKKLITRHESLRISFEINKGEPVQKIHEHVEFSIDYYETDEKEARRILACFERPFDLSKAPLLRVALINVEQTHHVLAVDMHHIISDGISQTILVSDFWALYRGEELSTLRLQYRDYAEWQNSLAQKKVIKVHEKYWMKEFEGEIPVLNIPTDYERDEIQNFEGSGIGFIIGKEETAVLRRLALEAGATLYMVLLALYNVLLSKISGQEDIVVGTTTAGRRHSDLEPIIGMFVNTIALRNYPAEHKTFREFLNELRERTIKAFENQEFQFENLVEKILVKREVNRNPIFDVMFSMGNHQAVQRRVYQQVENYELFQSEAVFDLVLSALETGENLSMNFVYPTRLFKTGTIKNFIKYLKEIISVVMKNKEIKIKDIKISHELFDKKLKVPQEESGFNF